MTIKDISEKIISDARIQADKIIAQAEDNANNIGKKSKKDADNIKNIMLHKYNQEASLIKNKIITEANIEAKKNILWEKQKIIGNVFSKALESVLKLADEDYRNIIKKMILNNIETGDETIFIDNTDREKISKSFIDDINKKLKSQGAKGALKLATSYLPIKGGVVLGSGKIRKNISLEFLLKKIREELEIQIGKDLFN